MTTPPAASKTAARAKHRLGDFTTNPRVLAIAGIAVVVASAGVLAGVLLLQLIKLATNVAYFGQFNFAEMKLQDSPLGPGRCSCRWPVRSLSA